MTKISCIKFLALNFYIVSSCLLSDNTILLRPKIKLACNILWRYLIIFISKWIQALRHSLVFSITFVNNNCLYISCNCKPFRKISSVNILFCAGQQVFSVTTLSFNSVTFCSCPFILAYFVHFRWTILNTYVLTN